VRIPRNAAATRHPRFFFAMFPAVFLELFLGAEIACASAMLWVFANGMPILLFRDIKRTWFVALRNEHLGETSRRDSRDSRKSGTDPGLFSNENLRKTQKGTRYCSQSY